MGLQLEFTQWEFTSPQAPADGVGGRVAAGASEDGAGPAAVAQRDPFKRVITMPKGWDTYHHVLRQLTPISQRNHPEGMAHHPVYPCHPQRALPRAPGPEAAAFYREPSLGEAPRPLEPVWLLVWPSWTPIPGRVHLQASVWNSAPAWGGTKGWD